MIFLGYSQEILNPNEEIDSLMNKYFQLKNDVKQGLITTDTFIVRSLRVLEQLGLACEYKRNKKIPKERSLSLR